MTQRCLPLIIFLASLVSISSTLANEASTTSSKTGAPVIEEVIVTGSFYYLTGISESARLGGIPQRASTN